MKRVLFLIFCFFIQPNLAATKSIPDSFADIIDPLLSSVVSIASTTIVEEKMQQIPQFPEGSPFEEFFKEYFDQLDRNTTNRPLIGLGSGFIIDKEGIVVTNNHVIEGADEIKIIMENGDEFEATVMGRDPKADIAVIKFEPKNVDLQVAVWGNSDLARVGDWAIAIGNPLGFGGSVTTGIVSAIARDIGSGPYVKFIQTDASINRGNSGGPLFNVNGQVIGINSAIISQTGGSIGLGFAIPSNSARKIVSQLREFGRTKRGWLGVQIQGVTSEIAESLGFDNNNGAFVSSVQEYSPAYEAGIEAGDIILEFNGTGIESYRDLPRLVGETDVGTTVSVKIWRKNESKNISVKLGELDEPTYSLNQDKQSDISKKIESIGIFIRNLLPEDYSTYELDEKVKGVFVTEVISEEISLDIGDIIIEINREKVSTVSEFENYVASIKETGRSSILLRVIRDKKTTWITINYL